MFGSQLEEDLVRGDVSAAQLIALAWSTVQSLRRAEPVLDRGRSMTLILPLDGHSDGAVSL
jgi:hypothetical protein